MATRVFLDSPGVPMESVVEGVGGAIQSSFLVSLTVDLSTTALDASSRQIQKREVFEAIENLKGYLEKINWPPV